MIHVGRNRKEPPRFSWLFFGEDLRTSRREFAKFGSFFLVVRWQTFGDGQFKLLRSGGLFLFVAGRQLVQQCRVLKAESSGIGEPDEGRLDQFEGSSGLAGLAERLNDRVEHGLRQLIGLGIHEQQVSQFACLLALLKATQQQPGQIAEALLVAGVDLQEARVFVPGLDVPRTPASSTTLVVQNDRFQKHELI